MAKNNNTPALLRDTINKTNISALAERLQQVWPAFDHTGFVRTACKRFTQLSLNDRIAQVRDALQQYLPDYQQGIDILLQALPEELEAETLDGHDLSSITGFIIVPQTEYAALYGKAHFSVAMNALYEMTKRFSAEGAIRHFLLSNPDKTLEVLKRWTRDDNPHVRRLVSEGTRPRLPMYRQLPAFRQDPKPVLQLLEKLKHDPVLYVRRSVANNLNDISKDHPELVTATLKRWQKPTHEHTPWITRHALRTLSKQGNPAALQLLGYAANIDIGELNFTLSRKRVALGESFQLSLTLRSHSNKPQPLMIDYIIHHKKANGDNRPKVFKWTHKTLAAGERLTLEKNHSMKVIGIRPYYAGTHPVELQINGRVLASAQFTLKV